MSGTSLTNLLTDGLCDMPCTGQLYGTDFCGGADRLSVYQRWDAYGDIEQDGTDFRPEWTWCP